jgi:hypothetical protein
MSSEMRKAAPTPNNRLPIVARSIFINYPKRLGLRFVGLKGLPVGTSR